MAENRKITQLSELTAPAANDLLVIVDSSDGPSTKHITRANLFGKPGPIGAYNPDTAVFTRLTLDGYWINGISNDVNLADASQREVPTEYAVKSYVDEKIENTVKLNIVHTTVDATAVIGDVVFVDTADSTDASDITIELIPTGIGKIVVYKKDPAVTGPNSVIIVPGGGAELDPSDLTKTQDSILYGTGSLEFLCDGVNFYTM